MLRKYGAQVRLLEPETDKLGQELHIRHRLNPDQSPFRMFVLEGSQLIVAEPGERLRITPRGLGLEGLLEVITIASVSRPGVWFAHGEAAIKDVQVLRDNAEESRRKERQLAEKARLSPCLEILTRMPEVTVANRVPDLDGCIHFEVSVKGCSRRFRLNVRDAALELQVEYGSGYRRCLSVHETYPAMLMSGIADIVYKEIKPKYPKPAVDLLTDYAPL